jgi:hypothetical protein
MRSHRYVEASPDVFGLIAEQHSRPLGVAHAFFIDEGRAEIAMLVANGARCVGVGRLLFDRLIAALQQRRCTSVIAFALAQNGAVSDLARATGVVRRRDRHLDALTHGNPAYRKRARAAGRCGNRPSIVAAGTSGRTELRHPCLYLHLYLRARVGVSLLSVLLHTRSYVMASYRAATIIKRYEPHHFNTYAGNTMTVLGKT